MSNTVIGVDIGGTHITACWVDVRNAVVLEGTHTRGEVDPLQDKEHVIRSWVNTIAACKAKLSTHSTRIGIAMPGPFEYDEGVSQISGLHKYECLFGLNVKKLLAAAMKTEPGNILLMNDATAFLMGEIEAWAGKGCENLVGVTLGTGLGSARYKNGKYEEGDLWSFPFRDSRAEEYLCSRWFTATYNDRTNQNIQGAKELAAKASHDAVATGMFKEFGYTLAEVLINRFSKDFPARVVIGGNIAKAWNLFHPHCVERLSENGFICEVLPARLGEDAALIGAACLWR